MYCSLPIIQNSSLLDRSLIPCGKTKNFGWYWVRRKAAPDMQEPAWHYQLALVLLQAGLAATAKPWCSPAEHEHFQKIPSSDKAAL